MKPLRLRDTALATLIRYLLRLRFCTPLTLCYTLFQRLSLLSATSLVQSASGRAFSLRSPLRAGDILSSPSFPFSGALALFAYGSVDYSLSAVRRGTNSIAPMTATATLLSSFVRAVLTWRHRTVTSNCKQPDDTSSAASPLIARTTPNPLRSRRHHLHCAQPRHHHPSQCITLPRQEIGVAVESKFGKPILALTPTI